VLQNMSYNDAVELVALADEFEMKSRETHDNNVPSDKLEMLHRAAVIKV
jgi:hypothetical protein